MEWTIPIQTFETTKVRLGPLGRGTKPLVPLAYTDADFNFTTLSLLLPHLTVKSYDSTTGRLSLSFAGASTALTKLQSLQETLLAAVRNQQATWFPDAKLRSSEEIREGYQPIIDHGCLHLFCPLSSRSGTPASPYHEVHVFSKGVWSRGVSSASLFTPGTPIRIALRIQGISFHQHPVSGMWTGKFRLQHRIIAVLSA